MVLDVHDYTDGVTVGTSNRAAVKIPGLSINFIPANSPGFLPDKVHHYPDTDTKPFVFSPYNCRN